MSEKKYCKDCEKYDFKQEQTGGNRIEFCYVENDDYYSKDHLLPQFPAVLNAKNDCSHFIKKEA